MNRTEHPAYWNEDTARANNGKCMTPERMQKEYDSEGRRDLARRIRARKQCQIALGAALFEAITGERPHIATPHRTRGPRRISVTLTVTEDDLL